MWGVPGTPSPEALHSDALSKHRLRQPSEVRYRIVTNDEPRAGRARHPTRGSSPNPVGGCAPVLRWSLWLPLPH